MQAPHPVCETLLQSYMVDRRGQRIGLPRPPSAKDVESLIEVLRALLFPGYFAAPPEPHASYQEHVRALFRDASTRLTVQTEQCLRYHVTVDQAEPVDCAANAARTTDAFFAQLIDLRAALLADAEAALDGDPAAAHTDEVIYSYPGFLAVVVYRLAHALMRLHVPLLPRMMTEWAHRQTGIDIHPQATIGPRFFIDHGTGVVIGQTAILGAGVRLYQGVTLGALSLPRSRVLPSAPPTAQRHPTIQDGVTIYANATILGGETVVGEHSVIGGSVFLAQSVPAASRVTTTGQQLRVQGRQTEHTPQLLDFQI